MRSLCRAPGVSGSCLPRMGGVSMFLVMQSSAGGWQHSSPSQKPGNRQACRNQLVLFSDRSCPPPATQPGAPRCHSPNTRSFSQPTPHCHPIRVLPSLLLPLKSFTIKQKLPNLVILAPSGPRCSWAVFRPSLPSPSPSQNSCAGISAPSASPRSSRLL